ncbi:MAG: nucleoside-diphosphate kinase [Candidatus Margulisbacteria bacterium]|nr:nucleoside-diphosphate kinase [Candidatus Margulisiibacteriota bacterium]
MIEQSLVFIKPDGVSRGLVGEVLSRFEKRGLTLLKLEMQVLTEALVDGHYAEHVARSFYPELKSYVMSGPVVVMVLVGENAIGAIRKMVGVTNSAEADAGTIRGDFALTTAYNIIHASDSVESGQREIKNFFG